MRLVGYRCQRTIARPVAVEGVGFLTGADVKLRFLPASASSGVVFVRADLKGRPEIEARPDNVTGTSRRTVLGEPPSEVQLVEHVLAALAALRIDNCRVEVNAPEPPGLDGSAREFVAALHSAGVVLQHARREIWACSKTLSVCADGAALALYPGPEDCLRVSYFLNYGLRSPIAVQRHTHVITPEFFCNGIDQCRTFLLQEEAEAFHRQGLGSRTRWGDLLVFGPQGPIQNRLRFADEPARHKILDLVGDLSLCGFDLRGHLVGIRSGHALNAMLVRRLLAEVPPIAADPHRAAAA